MKILKLLLPVLLVSFSASAELNLELPDLNLPEIGNHASNLPTSAKEREIGLEVLRIMRASGKIIEDPEINLWIRALGNRLSSHARNPIYFVVTKDSDVNAFATIGGVVVINAGLILRTSTESELAAAMAHEIAHVTQRHIARMIEGAKNNKLATSAALIVGILATSKNAQAGQAILNTTIATMAHKQLAFGRGAEAEADRVGLRVLAGAGYNPQGMPNFLQKLEQFSHDPSAEIREFLQNHPLTIKRVSDTRARANRYGNYRGRENVSYLYMREKIRALIGTGIAQPNSNPVIIKKYSKALQLKRRGSFAAALKVTGGSSRNISEAVLIAKLFNKQRQFKQTVAVLAPMVRTYPGNEALSIPLGQAYVSLGQIANAWKTVSGIRLSEQSSLELFEVKQEVARLSGNTSEAYRAAAEKNMRIGHYKAALIQIQQAIKYPGSNTNELRNMQHRLSQLLKKKRRRR